MRGMRPLSTGCVLRAKPNKKWTRDHVMRPSSTECLLQARDASFKFLKRPTSDEKRKKPCSRFHVF
ncbi:hypothetical protein HanPSC8_Chr01g0010301 [Helianthus annuus]|nr:hypothetical protein HanPSC8_Chr01g0010301 [Helianthus annuus]